MVKRNLSALVAVLVAVVLALTSAAPAAAARRPAPGAPSYPASMSSLGDSITRGFNVGGWFSDWPERSWSTGTDAGVNSHYTRLLQHNKRMKAYNNARSGAKMAALPGQASASVSQGAEYVTVLMGANDACTSTEDLMTPVSDFTAQFRSALETLAGQASRPKVLVASIPDVYQLYSVGKGSSSARSAWSSYSICQSMLEDPLSTDPADEERRRRVRQRVIDYNAALADTCADYSFCKYDGGAVFGYPFTLGHLSTWDYFHPNASGQKVLAETTYAAGFWPGG